MATTVGVTSSGCALVTSLLVSSNVKWVHWGTGTTPFAPSQSALIAPLPEARVAGTQTRQTTVTSNDTYQVVATLTKTTEEAAVTEAGIFNASTGGYMYCRAAFSPINVDVDDSIQFTFRIRYIHS